MLADFLDGGTVKQWFRWKWKAPKKQLLMRKLVVKRVTDTLLESKDAFHSLKSNTNGEPAMVCSRDAENEVLFGPRDGCEEKK